MSKTVVILVVIIGFLLLTNTAIERAISNGLWSLGNGVANETQYVVEGAGSGLLKGIDSVRISIGNTIIKHKNAFKYDIDYRVDNESTLLSYVFYVLLLFLSLFFVYKLLFYVLLLLLLYWLFIIIRNRF
jgi:hypothetical protein